MKKSIGCEWLREWQKRKTLDEDGRVAEVEQKKMTRKRRRKRKGL